VLQSCRLTPCGCAILAPELHDLLPGLRTHILHASRSETAFGGISWSTIELGKASLKDLRYAEELAIFNDEAHNTPAPEYDNVPFALSPKSRFRLDTTATPDRADGKTPDSRMIFDYSITDAQAEDPPIIQSVVVYEPKINFVQLTYTNPDRVCVKTLVVELHEMRAGGSR